MRLRTVGGAAVAATALPSSSDAADAAVVVCMRGSEAGKDVKRKGVLLSSVSALSNVSVVVSNSVLLAAVAIVPSDTLGRRGCLIELKFVVVVVAAVLPKVFVLLLLLLSSEARGVKGGTRRMGER